MEKFHAYMNDPRRFRISTSIDQVFPIHEHDQIPNNGITPCDYDLANYTESKKKKKLEEVGADCTKSKQKKKKKRKRREETQRSKEKKRSRLDTMEKEAVFIAKWADGGAINPICARTHASLRGDSQGSKVD